MCPKFTRFSNLTCAAAVENFGLGKHEADLPRELRLSNKTALVSLPLDSEYLSLTRTDLLDRSDIV